MYLLFIYLFALTLEIRQTGIKDSQFEQDWKILSTLIKDILNANTVKTSFQVAYELCQSLCLYGYTKKLYNYLNDTLSMHVQQEADILLTETKNETFLITLNKHWINYCERLNTIRNIFMELERRYIIRETDHTTIIQLGKHLFSKTVMGVLHIQKTMITNLLQLITNDRDDDITVDHDLIQSIVHMLIDLALYADYFEPSFLKSTTDYYAKESREKLVQLPISDYLKHAHKRIKQESELRINLYLDPSTKTSLTDIVISEFIYSKTDNIISQGFENMMDNDDKQSLHILYQYLKLNEQTIDLQHAFSDYIKKRGTVIVNDPNKDSQMVASLLQYKSKLDNILKSAFEDSPVFINALKESFEIFINSRRNKPAELIAKYIDGRLRKNVKKQAEEDIELVLDKVLVLFRYLQGKDIFEAFYKRFLSKRLLLNRSISNDMEKNILSKFKSECGPDFTKNLEGMFKDIEISQDLNTEFKGSKYYLEQEQLPVYVNVLAQGIWPVYSATNITLPPNILNIQQAFKDFYTTKFTGRKLDWQNSLGSCTVKANFPNGTKELSVSVFQATILLLFNHGTKTSIDYNDILLATNLDDKLLKKDLQSLACGQHKILIKHPNDNEIGPNDTFTFNENFTASTHRLKINSIQLEQSVEERKETQTKVLISRQHQLEAAIVRIMKSKKKLPHAALVNELFVELKFPIDATDIKKRIESLIDRDYLSRDETDNSLYIYQS
ncbi:cullin-4-like protein [Cunninghamella echinulata]|nr:cullin-4-like protein [Cunninghamella echinulata]